MGTQLAEDDYNDTEFDVESGKYLNDQDDVEVEASANDDIEIEIVDDAPTEDRGRKPLPKEVVEKLDAEDEAEEYSAKVKQRIDQMKKAWHDERRAKEAAQREREAAASMTKQLMEERNRLREELRNGEGWAIQEAKRSAELQLDKARQAYKAAYEEGDSDSIADAQQALSRATNYFDRVANMSPRFSTLQAEEVDYNQLISNQARAESAPEPDEKAQSWGSDNPWFGKDEEMTSFALGVHQKLVNGGVHPQSDEYYERIDARMREVFPEKFGVKRKRQSSTVVAPSGRTPKGKKVVLTQSQYALAKRLGLTPEQYAKEVTKLGEM